jgi:hypothetical protein
VNFQEIKLDVSTVVVVPVVPVEVFEFGVVVVVFVVFEVGVVVFELPELGDDGDDGDAGAVVVGAAGLKAIAELNSRPIESVMVNVNAAGISVQVDVLRLMVKVVTCQSPRGELEF